MTTTATRTASTTESSWLSASCVQKTQETNDTFTYEFKTDNAHMSSFLAGSHINVRIPAGKKGTTINRTYTLSSSPKDLPAFKITVKQVEKGSASNWLATHLKPGMKLEFTQPSGDFVLPEQTPGRILFIAAGSGVTPVMSMLRFLSETANKSEIDFLYYARSPQDIIFKEELDSLCSSMKGLKLNYCVEQSTPEWLGLEGRITEQHFSELTKLDKHEIYLCGPSPFMDAATSTLKTLGVEEYQIHKELFALDLGTVSVQTEAKVQFSGESSATQTKKKTLLDEAESRGLELASGCRSGICKTCRCKKISGETVNLLTGKRSKQNDEYILACVTQAVSDTLIEL